MFLMGGVDLLDVLFQEVELGLLQLVLQRLLADDGVLGGELDVIGHRHLSFVVPIGQLLRPRVLSLIGVIIQWVASLIEQGEVGVIQIGQVDAGGILRTVHRHRDFRRGQPDRDTADVSITAARAAQASLLSLSMVDFLLETE